MSVLSTSINEPLVQAFFTGKDVELNCLEYVRLDLDAKREVLNSVWPMFCTMTRGLLCLQIVAKGQQGKTMLMARLAHDLARAGKQVYWSRAHAQELLAQPELIKSFCKSERGLFRKPRIYLFLDEPVMPSESEGVWWHARETAAHLIEVLQDEELTITITSVKEVFPLRAQGVYTIGPRPDGGSDMSLTGGDTEAIIQKWQEKNVLDPRKAEEFKRQSHNQKLHRMRIFAFLSLLCDFAAQSSTHSFMKKFDDEYEKLRQEPDSHSNLLPIGACQALDVQVPTRIVEALDPRFSKDSSIVTCTTFMDKDCSTGGDDVYVIGAPLLTSWLLKKKLDIRSFADLQPVYSSIIQKALEIRNFGCRPSEKCFLPKIFHELCHGVNEDLMGGRGQFVARTLFRQFRSPLVDFFQGLVNERSDKTELVLWGWAFKALYEWDLAEVAYLKAAKLIGGEFTTTDGFRLVNGMKSLPRKTSRAKALPIAEALLHRLAQEGDRVADARRALFTAYCEILRSVDKSPKALQIFDQYQRDGLIEPDAGLYRTIASIYESLGGEGIDKAKQFLEEAVRWAKAKSPESLYGVLTLQRYAVFLADHRRADWPVPDSAFRQALAAARAGGFPWEGVVCAQADYQESLGKYRRARRLFEQAIVSYRKRDIVESHSWLGLATLLINHSNELGLTPQGALERAEALLREVVEDDFTTWRPKLMAFNVLGWTVGGTRASYSFKGKPRPDTDEAVQLLTNSFESPESIRDDPSLKTFNHDVPAHRALRDVYSRAVQTLLEANPGLPPDSNPTLTRLFELEEAHARRTTEGLPRDDTPGDKVRRHVLHNRLWLAFFLWHEKPRGFPTNKIACFQEAEDVYRETVEYLEGWGWGAAGGDGRPKEEMWPDAYKVYLDYAYFRLMYDPTDFKSLRELCLGFAQTLARASIPWQNERKRVRSSFFSLAVHFLDHARELTKKESASHENLKRAVELDETVVVMDEAWLAKFRDDQDVASKLLGLRDVIVKLKRRISDHSRN